MTRVFSPYPFFSLPIGYAFYLDAVLGGPSCFAGNRRRFKKIDEAHAIAIGAEKVRELVGSNEMVWVRMPAGTPVGQKFSRWKV